LFEEATSNIRRLFLLFPSHDPCGFPFICETITTPAWFDKQVKDLAEKQKKEQAKDK